MTDGEDLRDEGIERVLRGVSAAWSRAYKRHAATFFAGLEIGETFTGEQLREHAESQGLEQPHHPNCWGAMANSVLKARLDYHLVEEVGTHIKARDPKSHAHRYPTYRRLK